MDVYWFDDHGGVRLPKACRLKYWDGSTFVPVPQADGLGLAENQFNSTTFPEITTSRLRLEFDSDGRASTGLLEWRVYDSGKSPAFPPVVVAGLDRSVMLNGTTCLAGTVKSLKNDPGGTTVTWSKASGPGEVRFADPNALKTTATFSALGDYVLRLTGAAGALSSASTLNVAVHAPPPADRLDVVYTKRYKIDSPLWSARAKALIVNWIPHCIDYINRTNLRKVRAVLTISSKLPRRCAASRMDAIRVTCSPTHGCTRPSSPFASR